MSAPALDDLRDDAQRLGDAIGPCDRVTALRPPIEAWTGLWTDLAILGGDTGSDYRATVDSLVDEYADETGPRDILAVHLTEPGNVAPIQALGFSPGHGTPEERQTVRGRSIFAWLHRSDLGETGQLRDRDGELGVLLLSFPVDDSYVGPLYGFEMVVEGIVTPEEYDANVAVEMDQYLRCLDRGRTPGSGHTMDSLIDPDPPEVAD